MDFANKNYKDQATTKTEAETTGHDGSHLEHHNLGGGRSKRHSQLHKTLPQTKKFNLVRNDN